MMTNTTVCVSVCKCVAWCTVNTVMLLRLTPLLLSWRPFSIPHDFLLICCSEDTETAERCVCLRACVRVCTGRTTNQEAGLQLHLVAGSHRSNNKTPESKSNLLHNSHHTLSVDGGEVTHTCALWKESSVLCHVLRVWVCQVQDVSAKLLIIEPVDLTLTVFSCMKCFLFAFLKLCS